MAAPSAQMKTVHRKRNKFELLEPWRFLLLSKASWTAVENGLFLLTATTVPKTSYHTRRSACEGQSCWPVADHKINKTSINTSCHRHIITLALWASYKSHKRHINSVLANLTLSLPFPLLLLLANKTQMLTRLRRLGARMATYLSGFPWTVKN